MPNPHDTERLAHWLYFDHCDQLGWPRDAPVWTRLREDGDTKRYFRSLARAAMDFMYRGAHSVKEKVS